MRRVMLIIAIIFSLAGCARRSTEQESVFQQETCDYVLLIAIGEEAAADDRIFEFICYAVDQYFQDRIGTQDQVIIARIEGERPLIWQGTPRQLRLDFADAETFRNAIQVEREEGSLHVGLNRAMNLLLSTYSVAQGDAQAVTMVLSSMIDDMPSPDAEDEFYKTLVTFCKDGGDIAFYFCDQLMIEQIRERTAAAGLEWMILEPDVHGRPPLPNFE